jgi:hypothetical protein
MKTAKPKPVAPPEKAVQAALMRRLWECGFLVVRINSGAHKGRAGNYFRAYTIANLPAADQSAGFPDVMALLDGHVWLIEVKTESGALSDSQKKFAQCAAMYGVSVHVVHGHNEIDAVIDTILDEARAL